ncbi:MAG TPA: hypothetical protein VEL05_05080, partial [Candidatus Acidoferrum sp.]|nr:hypothetical protein [Candidatus Acidoferrum sp.]
PAARIAVEARGGRSEIAYRGTCPGGAPLVDTPVGRGCLPPAYAPAGLAADPARWVDRRLVGAPIDSVLRVRLERGGRTIAVERAADPDVLRAWLHRWRDAAAGPLVPADRLSPPLATVALDTDGGGREHLMIGRTPEGALGARRDGEPVALLLQPWADAHLEPAPHRFHSLDLLSHDPTALRGATARRGERVLEAIERGDTLEEWRAVAPARAQVAAAAVESLRQAVGFLRAETFAAERAQPRHGLSPPRRTIELQFDPAPAADPGQAQGPARPEPPARPHTIEIGAAIAGGACYARLDRDPAVFELSAARCTALLGPWTSPSSRRQPEH